MRLDRVAFRESLALRLNLGAAELDLLLRTCLCLETPPWLSNVTWNCIHFEILLLIEGWELGLKVLLDFFAENVTVEIDGVLDCFFELSIDY